MDGMDMQALMDALRSRGNNKERIFCILALCFSCLNADTLKLSEALTRLEDFLAQPNCNIEVDTNTATECFKQHCSHLMLLGE